MGQDKKQLTKLLAFVKDLYDDPDNKEFAAGIQAIALSDPKKEKDALFEEIYEYCIEKNARKQAIAVYRQFPIKVLVGDLTSDYLLMESFKRRGDFMNFSAHLFKQIEGIANYICKIEQYHKAIINIYNTPSLVLYNPEIPMSIFSRKKDSLPIHSLIFGSYNKTKDGRNKIDIPISQQYIIDKIKIALYLGGYATRLFSTSEFSNFSYEISNLYLIRCEADHRGNERTEKQERIFQSIIEDQDRYYALFIKLLHFFIDKISDGYQIRNEVFDYASNYAVEVLPGVVTSALPSALFIRCEGQSIEQVPSSSYNHSLHYENGMEVLVSKKGGTIIRVKPKEM